MVNLVILYQDYGIKGEIMLPWYSLVSISNAKYRKIENIRLGEVNNKLLKIELFSLSELIKIYPNFKKAGEYIIFDNDLQFNYKNYLLFENSLGFGGEGSITTFKNISNVDIIPGNQFRLCSFLRYPFEDMYIQSGLYIYNWMVKKISVYPQLVINNRRVENHNPRLGTPINILINLKIKFDSHKDASGIRFILNPPKLNSVVETREGFILNW